MDKPIIYPIYRDLPPEVIDQLVIVAKEKLPVDVDESIIRDIIAAHIQISKDYLLSQK